jgi:hypothetical protein
MKVKAIRVTVEHRVGLPDYSSVMMSVTEDVELEEGDKALEIRDKVADRLSLFIKKKLIEAEKDHAVTFKKKKP